MKKFCYIKGDFNDGDYVAVLGEIKTEDQETMLREVAKIMTFIQMICTAVIPYSADEIHTINEFKIFEIENEIDLLPIK